MTPHLPSAAAARAAAVLSTLLLLAPLTAQEATTAQARFDVSLGLAGGTFEHRTEASSRDDRTSSALLILRAEATTAGGFGGGLRLESLQSDDDLFAGTGSNEVEANQGTLFAHLTYRLQEGRFAMPIRIGFLLDDYQLADQVTDQELDHLSAGGAIELAPSFSLLANDSVRWSLFATASAGIAATTIDPDGDDEDYDSSTTRYGLELGTHVSFGRFDVGLSGIGRWQTMDESDPENGTTIAGYRTEFVGALLSFGIVF